MIEIMLGTPEYFSYILLFFILCAFMIYRAIRVRKSLYNLVGIHSYLLKNYSLVKLIIGCSAFCLGSFCIYSAFLSPYVVEHDEKIITKGRNLFIALDVSKSMNAVDCYPTRLACAKKKIEMLVNERLQSDNVGLILFSGCAFVLCPLTHDYQAFMNMLKMVDTETIASGTTSLDQPIFCAIKAFSALPHYHKHLILITDGEDFNQQIEHARLQAEKEQIKLYALGVGTIQGSPIAVIENGKQVGHLKDEKGSVVISKLQEDELIKLAEKLGGIYMKMTDNEEDIMALSHAIEQSEAEDLEVVQHAGKQLYPYLAILAFIFFAMQWIV